MSNVITSPHRKLISKGERNTKLLKLPDCSNMFDENSQAGEIESKLVRSKTMFFISDLSPKVLFGKTFQLKDAHSK